MSEEKFELIKLTSDTTAVVIKGIPTVGVWSPELAARYGLSVRIVRRNE